MPPGGGRTGATFGAMGAEFFTFGTRVSSNVSSGSSAMWLLLQNQQRTLQVPQEPGNVFTFNEVDYLAPLALAEHQMVSGEDPEMR